MKKTPPRDRAVAHSSCVNISLGFYHASFRGDDLSRKREKEHDRLGCRLEILNAGKTGTGRQWERTNEGLGSGSQDLYASPFIDAAYDTAALALFDESLSFHFRTFSRRRLPTIFGYTRTTNVSRLFATELLRTLALIGRPTAIRRVRSGAIRFFRRD